MTKQDLINSIAGKADLSKKSVTDVLEIAFDCIESALSSGEKVTITGFGTFSVSHRSARQGKNPRTKEVITIPASKTPHFKAGKSLKEAVNK